MIYAYNKGQRCLSLLVWLLGVDYVSCTSCTAGSKGHRSLLWGDATTSIFWGVGPSFHAFNESRPPCPVVHLSINSAFSVHDVNSISISTVLRAIKVIQV